MFLKEFGANEKNAFISLVRCIINADQKIAENEELLLNQFFQEMAISSQQIKKLSFDEAIHVFSLTDLARRKQVYVELFALAMCDAEYALEEQELLSSIAHRLNISEKSQDDLQKCVIDLLRVYQKMNDLIEEKQEIE